MRRFAVRIFASHNNVDILSHWDWGFLGLEYLYHSEGAAKAPITIIIKKGATLQEIADQLFH